MDEFYLSNQHTCKDCVKARVRQNRLKKIEYYRKFDRQRSNLPHRVEVRKRYPKTEAYRESHQRSTKSYRGNNPEKYAATNAVNNALRDGLLIKECCEACGVAEVEGHHDDYNEPLKIRWLCKIHHDLEHNN